MAHVLVCGTRDASQGCSRYRKVSDDGKLGPWTKDRPSYSECSAPARMVICEDCMNEEEQARARIYLAYQGYD